MKEASGDLVFEIAAEPRDASRGAGLVELLADRRHAFRDADHRAQRRLRARPTCLGSTGGAGLFYCFAAN
jgi:hypothetical protein